MTDTVADDQIEQSQVDWYSEDRATFGDRVVAAREAVGWPQKTLAKRLGVKLKTVRVWEDDLSEPRANKLQMLAGMLNVSLMWLLTGDGEGVRDPQDISPLPADVRELLLQMRQLRTQMCQNVEHMALLEKRLRQTLKEQI